MERAPTFAFTSDDFNQIREVVAKRCGIALADHKRQLVYGRLARRLRQLRIDSFKEYCALLADDDGEEIPSLVSAITTNVTGFFREAHHFEFLEQTLLPERLAARATRLRLWSAGCSSGEEAYSMAMTLADALPPVSRVDARVLATDIDADALAAAQAGIYQLEKARAIPPARLRHWFERGRGSQAGQVRVNAALRRYVALASLNLIDPWPMQGPFDAIFCRNVAIYFDKSTRRRLVDRFADLLRDGGYLFLGHSETVHDISDRFSLIGRTIYQKQS